MKERVLIVDDEPRIRTILSALLEQNGYEIQVVHGGQAALAQVDSFQPAVVLLDLMMPDMNGMDVLECLNRQSPGSRKVIIMTAHGEVRSAVEAMQKGAFDYLQKPFDNDDLLAVVSRAVEMMTLTRRVRQLEDQLQETYGFASLVGVSDKIKSVYTLMHKYAAADGTVLVTGESGTGKELVVRAIHQAGLRKQGPFMVVNCGAIPPNLIESEFFGHEAGSFTDAKQARVGKFEAAHGGTLFLDEVGDLPLEAQVKLLRVLEQGEFMRLGSNETVPVDVRVMAATNQDLAAMVESGAFRGDLYWRLNVLSLHICPLRERKEDIPLLVDHFLGKFTVSLGREVQGISERALAALTEYHWPGNVRELQNAVYSAVAVMDGQRIDYEDLPENLTITPAASLPPSSLSGRKSLPELAAEATAQSEQQAIQSALAETGGNKEKAAQILGIGRKTLYRKLKQYGMG